MAKEFLINKTLDEVRVAFLQDGEILDYLVAREVWEDRPRPVVGDIYWGRVERVLPGMQSAFVNIGHDRAAFLGVDDALLPDSPQNSSIASMLKKGERVLVQVAKEPISSKSSRITRQITLVGRYLVYMPFTEHLGVSRRIEEEAERERLKKILQEIHPGNIGLIARTMAKGQSARDLQSDYRGLMATWQEIQEKMAQTKLREIIYRDIPFAQRALRDIADDSVDLIYVDDQETFHSIVEFIGKYLPRMEGRVKYFNRPVPIFEHFGVDTEIERALSHKVHLKSGGTLHVEQTEALVSIDVNTGKFVGNRTLEENIFKTNLEAVREIAYQLRVRNCGGIIVIDFIDMEDQQHRDQVYQALLEELKRDRAKTNVLPLSELDLVEMTRKRTRETLSRTLCRPCHYCKGTGRVKSATTMCYEIIREVAKMARQHSPRTILLQAHPKVSGQLNLGDAPMLELLEKQYSMNLAIEAKEEYHLERYELHCQ